MRKLWAVILFLLCVGLVSDANASGTYARNGQVLAGCYSGLKRGEIAAGFRADFSHFGNVRLFNGNSLSTGDVRLRSYSLNLEYGVRDNASFYLSIPSVDNDSDTNAGATAKESGIGDIRIGAHKILWDNPEKHSAVLGTVELTVPGRAYNTTKLTAPGDNSVDAMFRLAYRNSKVFGSPFFYEVGLGSRLRGGTAPNQWLYDVELGVKAGPVALSAFIDSQSAVNGLGLGGPGFTGDFAVLKTQVTRLGGRLGFNLGNVDGEVYYAKAIQFQNQAPFDYYGLAISAKF